MNYPSEIYADTDLVCGEEPKYGHEKYVRAAEYEKLVVAVNNLVEIVEGVRNVRWAYDQWRLVDTPQWCDLYCAWCAEKRKQDNAELRHGATKGQ